MPDLIGRTLGGYRIVEEIGLGGMATVFKAYQPSMDRYVALKILSTHLSRDAAFAKRFRREAKVIARLEHARILPVYDHGQEDGYLYLVMRFVEAGTLKERIGQGPLSLEETRGIVTQVGSALEYAHRQGVIHRDLKPSNVLVDPQGDCYLTDFGIAKLVEGTSGLTGSGVIGTPHYMAPEQGQGLMVDQRVDVYAMGVVIYQMVTGQLPFDAETPIAVMLKHITEPLPLPRNVRPDVPERVEQVILKALAKTPDDRFQSMGNLVNAFDQAVPLAPVKPPTAAPPSPLRPVTEEAETSETAVVPTSSVAKEADVPATGVEPAQITITAQRLRELARTPRTRWLLAAAGLLVLLLIVGVFGIGFRRGNEEPTPGPTVAGAGVAAQATQEATLTPPPTSAPAMPTSTRTSLPDTPTSTHTPVTAPTLTIAPTATETPRQVPPSSTPALPTEVPRDTPTPALEPPTPTPSLVPTTPTPTNTPRPALQVELLHTLTAKSFAEDINGVAFSPDGTILAAAKLDSTVRLWRVSDGEYLSMLESVGGGSGLTSISFAPDGTILAAGAERQTAYNTVGKVWLWRISDWAQFRILEDFPERTGVNDVAFAPDGATLAAGGLDGIVRLWQVPDGPVSPVHTLPGYHMAYSSDGGLLASALEDGRVQLWRTSDWAPLGTLIGHTARVNSLAFSLRGTILASGADDNTVRVWQPGDGTLLHTLEGHTASVNSLAFSPDGEILASGSSDRTIRLWAAEDGALLITLEEHLGDIWSLAFSPDGTILASGSQDGTVRMWSVQR